MVRTEAGINRCGLFCLRIVELNLPTALDNRKCFRGGMVRPLLAERQGLILPDAGCDPHTSLLIHGKAVGIRLALPDGLVAPVRRWLHGLRDRKSVGRESVWRRGVG